MRNAITIGFKPKFFRHYNKLPAELQEEVTEAVQRFRANPNDPRLKVHKLKGRLRGELSFSVNYAYRILFFWEHSKKVVLLAVGDHDVYK
jgi:mRNA-degrading endonuclease RelE of RelBE toxin-antitoxin system